MAGIQNYNAAKVAWVAQYAPANRFSLEADKVFDTYDKLYATVLTSPTMYAGNVVSVIQDWTGNAATPTSTDPTTFKTYKKGIYYVASYGTDAEIIYVGNSTEYYSKAEIDTKISIVYKYQGSLSRLPNIDAVTGEINSNAWTGYKNGDVYNITSRQTLMPYNKVEGKFENAVIYPAGTNFAFVEATYSEGDNPAIVTPAHWDALGGVYEQFIASVDADYFIVNNKQLTISATCPLINKIETIKLNGEELNIQDKSVNIVIPEFNLYWNDITTTTTTTTE